VLNVSCFHCTLGVLILDLGCLCVEAMFRISVLFRDCTCS